MVLLFQQVATGVEKAFEWYLTAVRPFVYDEQGQLLLFLAFALQLDPNHHNIKRKLGAKSQYDIIKFAQAFNLV